MTTKTQTIFTAPATYIDAWGYKVIVIRDSNTCELIRTIHYNQTTNKRFAIKEYDPFTNKIITTTLYHPDGETIQSINKIEYDPITNKSIRAIGYHPKDEKTILHIFEFCQTTGQRIKETHFHPDGAIKKEIIHQ